METAVVDANIFIHGKGEFPFEEALTVPEVLEEVKSQEGKNVLANIRYEVREPNDQKLSKVMGKSDEINSPTSREDEKLLALALTANKPLLTDDKPLQNLALHLDADFEGFLDDKTDEKFRWKRVCENCGEEIEGEKCSSCGATLSRLKQVRCS